MHLYYNRIIGGMRLRQEQAPEVPCQGEMGRMEQSQKCFSSPYYLEPDIRDALEVDSNLIDQPGGQTVWLKFPDSQAAAREQLRQLEDARWFSYAAQKIEIFFASYNAIARFFTLTYINIVITRGGHFWKQVAQTSMEDNMYKE